MDISLDWLNQHKPGNTAKFFNLEFLEQVDDTYKIKVTFPPESTNPMNMVQGGMIAAAMDDYMCYADDEFASKDDLIGGLSVETRVLSIQNKIDTLFCKIRG